MSFESSGIVKDSQAAMPSAERNREEWLIWRLGGLGGSDAAAIIGKDPYRSPLDVFIEKTNRHLSDSQNLILQRGIKMEPLAADRYVEETGRRVRAQPGRVHPEHDCVRCSIDRQIIAGPNNPTGLLELKTANSHVFRQMKMDGIPEKYVIQIMHKMMVWGYDWASVGVLCPDTWEFMHFDIEQNQDIADALLEAELDFWKLVQNGTPPETKAKPLPKMPEVGGELVMCDEMDFVEAVNALTEATSLINQAGELKDSAQARVKQIMDAKETDSIQGGGKRFYHKMQAGRKTFNKKAFQAAHPDIPIDDYYKQGNSFMSFRSFDVEGF